MRTENAAEYYAKNERVAGSLRGAEERARPENGLDIALKRLLTATSACRSIKYEIAKLSTTIHGPRPPDSPDDGKLEREPDSLLDAIQHLENAINHINGELNRL